MMQSENSMLTEINTLFNTELFTAFDYKFNVGELLLVPIFLLISIVLIRLLG